MKIILKVENKTFKIPVPISLATFALRLVPEKILSKSNKKLALVLLKKCKKELKLYKGLDIVEIKSSAGEEIRISV